MENLVKKADELTMSHFRCNAKDFIEQGVKKGRHYFYLRDVLGLTDKKFIALLNYLGIDVAKVEATKQDFYALFAEPEIVAESMAIAEDAQAYA